MAVTDKSLKYSCQSVPMPTDLSTDYHSLS